MCRFQTLSSKTPSIIIVLCEFRPLNQHFSRLSLLYCSCVSIKQVNAIKLRQHTFRIVLIVANFGDFAVSLNQNHGLKYIYIYIYVTPRVHTATTRRSGSRTRDSGAGGGRSNEERQRLQPLEHLFLRSGE